MKIYAICLLGTILAVLISGSIQSISADHLEPGQGIFKSVKVTNISPSVDSEYRVYLQNVIRNGDGNLIAVTENIQSAAYIPHEITDRVFDTLMGEKEIVIIDEIKYEKVQYIYTPALENRWINFYPIFSEIPIKFEESEESTALMYGKNKDYGIWKIHYCADFKSTHGYQCIAIFQVLTPIMTIGPYDTVEQQWTVLRELN